MTIKKAKEIIDFSEYGLTKLKPKHRLFIAEYIINGNNATQAYLTIFPESAYSTARNMGSRLLARKDIAKIIDDFYDDILDGKKAEYKQLLHKQHIGILKLKAKDVFNPDGTAKKIDELDDDIQEIMEGCEVKHYGKDGLVTETVFSIPSKKDSRKFVNDFTGATKETKQIDLTTNGKDIGVLAVPQGMTIDEWINEEKEGREE